MIDWTEASFDYRLTWILGRIHQRRAGRTDKQVYSRLKKRADRLFGERHDTELRERCLVMRFMRGVGKL